MEKVSNISFNKEIVSHTYKIYLIKFSSQNINKKWYITRPQQNNIILLTQNETASKVKKMLEFK